MSRYSTCAPAKQTLESPESLHDQFDAVMRRVCEPLEKQIAYLAWISENAPFPLVYSCCLCLSLLPVLPPQVTDDSFSLTTIGDTNYTQAYATSEINERTVQVC